MTLMEIIKGRRSIRAYDSKPVEKEKMIDACNNPAENPDARPRVSLDEIVSWDKY